MKIEENIFSNLPQQNVLVPEYILYRLHESEERKGLQVEAKLVDVERWQKDPVEEAQTFKQCMFCNRWATNPSNHPQEKVIWKDIEEFDPEEKREFQKALASNPMLLTPSKASGYAPIGQTTGVCEDCLKSLFAT